MKVVEDNIMINSDSYKVSHHKQTQEGTEIVESYLESRGGEYDKSVFFGLQYIIKKHLVGQVVTKEYIDMAEMFWDAHFGYKGLFNREMWEHILNKHNGYLPIRIKAVPEGTVVPIKNVLMTIKNLDNKCASLTNFLETLLLQIWAPITIASNSRAIKLEIVKRIMKTDSLTFEEALQISEFMMQDFGFRGTSCLESASVLGSAHLTSFKGTDNVPAIVLLMNYYNAEMCGFSVPACYDKETEILTNSGWKYFKNLTENDLVAQYNNDKTIDFVKPLKYIKEKYNGELIHFKKSKGYKYIDAMVTPNHRMVKLNDNLDIKMFEAGDFSYNNRSGYSHRSRPVISGKYNNIKDKSLSDLNKLRIAFQADGSFASHKDDYNGERCNSLPIRFSFKKNRKKERLIQLLDNIGYKYTYTQYKNNYHSFWINTTDEFVKDFSWVNINKLSYTECCDFINELQYWDGSIKNNCISYASSNKYNIDVIQSICAISNHKTQYHEYVDKRGNSQISHSLTIQINKSYVIGKNIIREHVPYDDYVYCVSVPSKMIITRRNNIVLICGNSEHSTATPWGRGDGERDYLINMLTQHPTGIVSIVSDSFDVYNFVNMAGTDPEIKSMILERDGKCVFRPDSGSPVEVNRRLVNNLWDNFGGTTNDKGYKILNPKVGIIQGDGIDKNTVNDLLDMLEEEGFSATTLVYGSGGGLLQKFNRDTMKFAIKCSSMVINGKEVDVQKDPITAPGKKSKTGRLKLVKTNGEYHTITSNDFGFEDAVDELVTVFENGKLLVEYNLDEIRERAQITKNDVL